MQKSCNIGGFLDIHQILISSERGREFLRNYRCSYINTKSGTVASASAMHENEARLFASIEHLTTLIKNLTMP